LAIEAALYRSLSALTGWRSSGVGNVAEVRVVGNRKPLKIQATVAEREHLGCYTDCLCGHPQT
jgi:hypothetical protein